VQSAPLWLRNAILPGNALDWAKVALQSGARFITPTQFGPISRKCPDDSTWRTFFSSLLSFAPSSANPAENYNRAANTRIQAFLQHGRDRGGRRDNNRQINHSQSPQYWVAPDASTFARCGLWEKIVARKAAPAGWAITVRPTLAAFLLHRLQPRFGDERLAPAGLVPTWALWIQVPAAPAEMAWCVLDYYSFALKILL